jgi:hypothetical protein
MKRRSRSLTRSLNFQKIQWLFLPFLIGLCFINFYGWIFQARFEGDIASRMLLVLGPKLGLGAPYKGLWEIIPPGYIVVLQTWAFLFGTKVIAFVFLHFIVLLTSAFFLFLVFKKYFVHPFLFVAALGSTALTLFSPGIHSMYISSESFGVVFSLAALFCLLYIKDPLWKIGLATTMFFIAGQMKDPFLFGIFAVGPFFLWEFLTHSSFSFRGKLIFSGILGLLIPFLFFAAYLGLLGSFHSYSEVLNYKTQFRSGIDVVQLSAKAWPAFELTQRIVQLWQVSVLNIIYITIVIRILSPLIKKIKITAKEKTISISYKPQLKLPALRLHFVESHFIHFGIFLFIFGSFIGMALQGSFSTHYLIQSIVPLYLALGMLITFVLMPFGRWLETLIGPQIPTVAVMVIAIALLTPKPFYVRSYVTSWQGGTLSIIPNIPFLLQFFSDQKPKGEPSQLAVEEVIRKRVPADDCILHVYGWHVASTYIYSQRKPCSRFFLPNIVGQDWQKEEYQKSILENPPGAIVYGIGGADLNIKRFEQETINISLILEKCYVVDPQFVLTKQTFSTTLFWPKYAKTELKKCVTEAASSP